MGYRLFISHLQRGASTNYNGIIDARRQVDDSVLANSLVVRCPGGWKTWEYWTSNIGPQPIEQPLDDADVRTLPETRKSGPARRLADILGIVRDRG
jgi:hypothetical protein